MSKGLYITAVAATASVLVGACCAYHVYKKNKKTKIPTTWKEVGSLKDIFIYPIKSCGPIQRNRAECTSIGLRDGWLRDRVLMVVDDKYNFITARAFPKMLLIQPSIEKSILTLNGHGIEAVETDLAEIAALQKPTIATIWSFKVPVYNCGWETSEWLSRFLSESTKTYHLVFYASKPKRAYTHFYNNKYTTAAVGIYADESPYNLLNEASMNDLNERLNGVKVGYKNFRTNLLLSGAKPYEEDNWTFLKIGENIFEILKPCTRCVMTTLDPLTGTRNLKAEPLITLKSYRQVTESEMRKTAGSSPRMGLQMILRSGEGGFISSNDKVYAA